MKWGKYLRYGLGAIAVAGVVAKLLWPHSFGIDYAAANQPLTRPIAMKFARQVSPDFAISVEPETTGRVELIKGRWGITAFNFVPDKPLAQNSQYEFRLSSLKDGLTKQKFPDLSLALKTAGAVEVLSATQGPGFMPGDAIVISFNSKMNREETYFDFPLQGEGRWVGDSEYRYTPSDLRPDTAYKYKVRQGALSQDKATLVGDRTFQINTNGALGVVKFSPANPVPLDAQFIVEFNQVISSATLGELKISPGLAGSWTKDGKKAIFRPSNKLAPQTTYQITVAKGAKPKFGLPLAKKYIYSLTSAPETTQLNVPYFKQELNVTCEAAALRMALAFYGYNYDENDILQKFGYFPRVRDIDKNFWDDPKEIFVGLADGKQNTTGYGVHAGPVATASRALGRPADSFSNVSVQFIAEQIRANHPVILWGYYKIAQKDTWDSPNGPVEAYKGEHVRTVTGVVGSVASPIGFFLNDPYKGQIYWSATELAANLNILGALSNQAVVVY